MRGRPVRIVHTADCHIGSTADFGTAESAFGSLIDHSIALSADVLVIAGDLFDSGAVTADRVSWVAGELRRLNTPVVALPGNHDPWGARSIYRGLLSHDVEGLHVITASEGQSLVTAGVTFWGRALESHKPDFRPLMGVPQRPTGWGVVLAHGLVMAGPEPTLRGSPIYPADLAQVTWDYIALGHWPQFRPIVGYPAPAYYSGALATSRDGRGGAVLVDLKDPQISVSRLDLSSVVTG